MVDDPRAALVWPRAILKPAQILPNVVPFSRSGGRSLGGLERVTRTDRGWWSIQYRGVSLGLPGSAARRAFAAIGAELGGMAGLIAVPVWSYDVAPWTAGSDGRTLTTNSDGSRFADGAYWQSPTIAVEMAAAAAIGDTSVTLRLVTGISDLSGVRFSHRHALYRTGRAAEIDGDEWTVSVTPAIRAAIPADAPLELDMPTCLVRLASDRAMDGALSAGKGDRADVAFIEAVDVWNDLAAEAALAAA